MAARHAAAVAEAGVWPLDGVADLPGADRRERSLLLRLRPTSQSNGSKSVLEELSSSLDA